MNDLWNTLLQWLHRVGLHPDREAVEQAANQTREIEQSLANGQKQRQAEALRTEIEAKKQKMNNEMTQITENKARSRNVSAEMQSVTTRYQKEIESLNQKLSTLQAK